VPVRSSHLLLLCLASAGIAWGSGPQPSRGLRASPMAPRFAPADTRPQRRFDARGRYYPTRELTVKGHRLFWLELSVHYASIELSPPAGDTETVLIDCGHAVITPDTLYVSCAGDAIGSLTMTGAFLDKKGDFMHRPEVIEEEILEATVSYKGQSGQQSEHVRFKYGVSGGL